MTGCSIRALWILNPQDAVVFSRRFPVVERRWRLACDSAATVDGRSDLLPRPLIPSDPELAAAFSEKRKREGSARGSGVRIRQSVPGSDSWFDDPVARHVISVSMRRREGEEEKKEEEVLVLWPLVLHVKGGFSVLVLPLVEPSQFLAFRRMCVRSGCGDWGGEDGGLSSLLLDLPCITGAFMVAHNVGDIITGDLTDPEVVISSSHVGGLLDTLTGSIGITNISARAKPSASPAAASITSGTFVGAVASDTLKSSLRPIDRDALRAFISGSMPFGTPLDLNVSNILAMKTNGFASADMPPADVKQPAWKPYLYKGRQRVQFTFHEIIHASMYDREEIPDTLSISGQLNCRAELEGLPDVSFPLNGLNASHVQVLSFHHCVQVPEQGIDKQGLVFSPPLGNFALLRFQAQCNYDAPVKGFFQLSMVSEDEGAFLFKLRLMENYKAPYSMEFCTVSMPFPRRRVASFGGNPSAGTASMTDHSIEWKIITSGRGITGKSIEATYSGTVKFLPLTIQRPSSLARPVLGIELDEDNDVEHDTSNVEEYLMEKMNKDLQAVDMDEPFCWQAYNFAKVSFKVVGGTLSGVSVDSKSVNIYPNVKAQVEVSMQASSGDYILWNSLGKCPLASQPDQ